MEYDIESILEKYEDDYNPGPRPMDQEPRNMYSGGGLARALMLLKNFNKTGAVKGLEEKLIKQYKSQGMEFIDAIKKAQTEAGGVRYEGKIKIIDNAMKETNVMSDDYVDLLDMKIKLEDPDFAKQYVKFSENLKNKTRSRYDSDWAEANFGEEYGTKLDQARVREINESIDPNITERSLVDDIDDMNIANTDEFFGRKKNAAGGLQRNMYNQGQLVQPNADGSRPGYSGEDEVTKLAKEYQKVTGSETKFANIKSRIRNNTITKELIDKYKSRGAYGSGFRGKEIEAVTNPKFYKTILSELNKVKKQINKNVLFDYEDVIRTGKWYKNLRTKLGNLNEVDTDTIIKKVLSEEFPGSYYGKTAMRDFRRDKVVKAYLNYLDVNGSLDGGEKRLKELKIFQGTEKKQFRNINESFKEWTKGEFEVKGVDRKKLNPDQLKELKDWSPEYSSIKSVANEKQLKFLNDLNTNNPNLSTKEIKQKFFKQFPDVTEGAFNHRITHLTQLKNSGSYGQGGGNTRTFKWATKGDRSPWLKELLGLKFQGNYSSFINRGDKLLAQGLTKEANRLYNAAEKYFGSNGVFTKFEGQGEHPFSRIFGSGPIGNELKINSLVRGDLNSFKRLNFDEPVIQLLTEYNKSTTLPERRNKIKTLIEDRKKLMNYLTESPNEKGIVESVKFNYGPEKMSVSANVVDIDKVKNFNPEDYVKRGESYLKSFETKGKNLFDDSGKIVQKKILDKDLLKLAGTVNKKCKGLLSYGGRAGLAEGLSPEFCINEGKKVATDLATKNIKASPAQNLIMNRITSGVKNFAKSILDPKELFDFKKQFLSKGALIGAVGIDAIFAADDALRKDMDPKEAFAKTLFFGNIPSAAGFTDNVDVLNAKKMLENPNLSPAGKEYAQLIIDSTNLNKGQSDTGIVESFKTLTEGPTNQFKNLQELKNKVSNASTSGRFDYENALAEMQGTFKAKPKENKFFFDDAPDKPDVTPLTNKLATSAKSRGPMTEMKKQKVDYTPLTYQNYKPFSFTKEEFEDTMRQVGSLKEGQIYNDDFYKETIEAPMKASQFKEFMEVPGFKGTQNNFSEGGIASLNVKK